MQRIDLGERPRDRNGLAQWYAAALEDQASSGLSVTDYAFEIGVTAATLYQWRRRLSAPGGGDRTQDGAGLVEVTVKRGPVTENAGSYVVRVRGVDRCIEVPRGFDCDELRRLVTLLESC